MGFWHIYRLLHAKRWLLALLVLVAAALIFAATAIQANRSETFTEAKLGLQQEPPSGPSAVAPDKNDAIDNLVGSMSSNATVIAETATLLKLPEDQRAREVKRILEQNGQFATWDIEVPTLVAQRVRDGELPDSRTESEILKMRREVRTNYMNLLAKPTDTGGGFARGGVQDGPADIQKRIREVLKVEAVPSLDSSDNTPKYSNFVRISGKFPREAEANLYVNMFCLAFMDWYRKSNNNSSNQRIGNLKDQLAEAEARLKRARKTETLLTRNPDVAGPSGQIQNAVLNAETKANALSGKYQDAMARIEALRKLIPGVKPTNTVELPIGEKTDVQKLQIDLTSAEAEYRKLEAASPEGSGSFIATPAQAQKEVVETLRTALARAKRQPNTRTEINPSFQQLQLRLSAATEDASGARAELIDAEFALKGLQQRQAKLPAVTGALDDTREEIRRATASISETTRQIELARASQISVSKSGTLSLISQAVPLPSEDSWSRRARLILFGSVLALLVGIVAVIGLDALDNRIKDTRDVEQVLELPIAGVIPAQIPDPQRAPRITYLDPLSPVSEAYRLLRTDILFTRHDHPFQSLLGVGVKPGQGTTTTICNLAITLAQAGNRVILVDGDLRRPRLHETFQVPSEHGLTSLLLAHCSLEDALQHTEIDNLMILPAGPPTTQPSELLGSREMRELHETLKQAADFVLFDSPSAITFADAAVLASFLDATVIVIRANEVPRKAEQDVRALLDRARANIIGVVLNAMPADRVDSAHYHSQYYPAGKKPSDRPQLPGKGGDGPRTLPGGDRDIWSEDSSTSEALRPAARQEAPEPEAPAEAPSKQTKPLSSWRTAFVRKPSAAAVSPTLIAEDSADEEGDEPDVPYAPPVDYSQPYSAARVETPQPPPIPDVVTTEVTETEEAPQPSVTPAVDDAWLEDVEALRKSILEGSQDGDAAIMPGTLSAPARKRGLLGLLKR